MDVLPTELWQNPNATFLDPVTKSGVFLREIAKRLMLGLATQIPDVQTRINHIFTKQIFGIAITELTSLLARRSVYCSKTANSKFSVCDVFENEQGNIIFERTAHTWHKGNCKFCGASEEVYSREDILENFAYQFIHTENPEKLFNMKFDVIIGNPPYQLSDEGFGRSASPIYHRFVQQAIKLNPRYLTMIIPARWYSGGKGLDDFREGILNDKRISKLVDYYDASECFAGVDIAGGICYFLWEKEFQGDCEITNILKGVEIKSIRPLNEFKTFIRHGGSVPILKKVININSSKDNLRVSSRKPFGLATNDRPSKEGDLILLWNGGSGPFERKNVKVGIDLIDKWKVITSKVSYDHGGQPDKEGKRRVLSKVEILPPKTICTETYIIAGSYDTEIEAINLSQYLRTKFVRFLISQLSFSQDITKERFAFVPLQDFNEAWTDKKLYAKYGITAEEIAFIDSLIRPMELKNE